MLRIWWPGTSDELSARFVADASFKNAALAKLSEMPGIDAQLAWTRTTHRGSAADLASLHRSIATGRIPGRHYLELAYAPAVGQGELGIGYKGGSLPGVVTIGFSLRRKDGTVATSAVLVEDLSWDDFKALSTSAEFVNGTCLGLVRDPATWQRVSRELVHA
jgi:hypothetical protein